MELARFINARALEPSTCDSYVSRLFLVPKPGNKQWRLIYDLRPLNKYCVRKRLRMETLLGVKKLLKKGDYMSSFDLKDGFFALGRNPTNRAYFTLNVRGLLCRLAGLPMRWSPSPFYFCNLT
jgi:hypothetical protein